MADNVDLLSHQEIDDFLVQMDKKKCPWCDGHRWGLHTDMTTEPATPRLRSMPSLKIYKDEDGKLKGTVNVGTEAALAVIVAECGECGYVYTFNYFTVMSLLRAKKNNEVTDGHRS